MRKSKKQHSQPRASDDEAFGRLYHTIPNARPGTTMSPGSSGFSVNPVTGLPEGGHKSPRNWKKILKRTLIILAIVLALAGLWLGWKVIANGVKIFGWDGLADIFQNRKLKGEDEGRVNILLAGNSTDDPGHAGADLTDSVMLASINTKDKTGYILSIPRDLYVEIPGSGYAKINEAYQRGERTKFKEPDFAEGGMGMLEKTVSYHFGVPIHYYALVNYTSLQQAVDAVGGVTITVQSTDPRGLYDPSPDLRNSRKALVRLPNGEVSLDGRTALNLARARGNARGSYGYGQGDFTRTEHQRKILVGLKDKASSAGTLSNPVKMGQLLDSMGNNVKTDFEAGELRRLYKLGKEVPSGSIQSASLNKANGKNLLKSYTTRTRQSALIPVAGVDDYSDIRAFISGL